MLWDTVDVDERDTVDVDERDTVDGIENGRVIGDGRKRGLDWDILSLGME